MLRLWITAVLMLFLTVNGLVVAGDSASHASHDAPGALLHAQDHQESAPYASSVDHDDHGDCDGGHHDCHSHANSAPLSTTGVVSFQASGTTWQPRPQSGAVLSGRQPPVPPPNTTFL